MIRVRIPVPNRPPKVILPRKGKGAYKRSDLKAQLKRYIVGRSEVV